MRDEATGAESTRGGDADARGPFALLAVGVAMLVLSGWGPHDRVTWVLEVLPILIGAPILIATYPRFPLTPLLYRLLFFHAIILMVGGHYTYAEVPLGGWLERTLDLSRNPYDRIGHLAQGFVPAVLVREIFIRHSVVRRGPWLVFVVLSVCLAISASYELSEWLAAEIGGEAADSFLGMQGDMWDTQWDMLFGLCGAILSIAMLSGRHDRELAALEGR